MTYEARKKRTESRRGLVSRREAAPDMLEAELERLTAPTAPVVMPAMSPPAAPPTPAPVQKPAAPAGKK